MDGSHWLGSVAFELRSRDAKSFDLIRRALRSDVDAILVRPLQRALDHADRPNAVVRYRRIEVDLGRLGPNDLGEGLARRIKDQLERQLGPGGVMAADLPPTITDEAAQLKSFLATGVLAWPAPAEALAAICAALAAQDDAEFGRQAMQLRSLLASTPQAAERLVRQCPAELVGRIAAALAGSPNRAFWRLEDAGRFLDGAAALHAASIIVRIAQGEADTVAELKDLADTIAGPPEPGASRSREREASLVPRATPVADDEYAAKSSWEQATLAKEETALADVAVPAALPLGSAGLVLLHPFLTGLFSAVGLLDEKGGFIDADAQARGVLLLQFVATGQEAAAEPDLPLAKLLCGMDLNAIVPRQIDPTEAERTEAEALLDALIANWDALRDTSHAALRETFLKRPGRMQREGENWRLIIEPRGVDVLIDRLPWAISIVKTPFMDGLLRVDWR